MQEIKCKRGLNIFFADSAGLHHKAVPVGGILYLN